MSKESCCVLWKHLGDDAEDFACDVSYHLQEIKDEEERVNQDGDKPYVVLFKFCPWCGKARPVES